MVSGDGGILSCHYHVQSITPVETRNRKIVDLESELSDGSFVITNNVPESPQSTTPPGFEVGRHPAGTLPDELLRDHRERLTAALAAQAGLTAKRIDSWDDSLEFQWRMQALQFKDPSPTQTYVENRLLDKELQAESFRALARRAVVSALLPAGSATPAPQRGLFPALVRALKKQWKQTFPFVRPLKEPAGQLQIPKASSFYAGTARPSGWHVFLWFQHSPKPWQVGQFTLNVILCADPDAPNGKPFPDKDEFVRQSEGSYRIGFLLGNTDKWWHLKDDNGTEFGPRVITEWQPTTYADFDIVLRETVADVTRAAAEALRLLGLIEPTDASLTPAAALPFAKCPVCNAIFELSRDSLEEWYQKNRPQLRIGDLVPQVCTLCGEEPRPGDLAVVRVVPSDPSPKVVIGTPGIIESIEAGSETTYLVALAGTSAPGRFRRDELFLARRLELPAGVQTLLGGTAGIGMLLAKALRSEDGNPGPS